MPAVANDVYAVDPASVAVVYKTDIDAVPPLPASYLLTVIPKGIGKPQSPQFRFDDADKRDSFYKELITAMP